MAHGPPIPSRGIDVRAPARTRCRTRRQGPTACVAALLVLTGCARGGSGAIGVSIPVPTSVVAESAFVRHSVPERAGQIPPWALDSVAPRIRSLRTEPAELDQAVGDTIRVSELVRVIARDSAGTELGELRQYDFGFSGRGFRLLADGRVRLARRGTVTFVARLPRTYWRGSEGSRPRTAVAIRVHER